MESFEVVKVNVIQRSRAWNISIVDAQVWDFLHQP
mgnify:CR=1 FL=1